MSKKKSLQEIKHSEKVLSIMQPGKSYFVDEIRRYSGLDPKTLTEVIRRLARNEYLTQDQSGRWTTL